VTIAVRAGASLDGCVERHRKRTRITLVAVCRVRDRHERLALRDDDEGNAVIGVLTEVGVEARAAAALDRRDDRRRVGVQRGL
jgi:hypothetical protein